MSVQTAADKAIASAHKVTEGVMHSAQSAVESTREAAHNSLDKAEQGVRALRSHADPAIDDLAARAQDLANRSIEYCAETSARARRQMQQAAQATTQYVSEQPGKSLLIAAASGAALATLVMWLSRRHPHPVR